MSNKKNLVHLWMWTAHLLASPVLFSFIWQHDGNRCLQINGSKVTCNHPRFSSLDVFALTVTRKMSNWNLFQKITGTSYETGYLTCKSFRWFITASLLVCPRFQASTCACVCVDACAGEWMTARQWKRCHYWADVCASCDRGQGHITGGGADTLRTGNITLWFPCRGETLLSQSAMPLFDLI